MPKKLKSISLTLLALSAALSAPAHASGTWKPFTNAEPAFFSNCLQLTDGTAMCADGGTAWYKLTPDIHGSYTNGTWTQLASMNDSRLYYSSQVLPNGNVFVAGGEYGTGADTAEIYNPLANTWTYAAAPPFGMDDSISDLLPNGTVLDSNSQSSTAIYNPATNSWTSPISCNDMDETDWEKLPDGSILALTDYDTDVQRYIPSLGTWVTDAGTPVNLFGWGEELGSGHLLPNGNVFWIGGSPNTAIYTPSGTSSPGSWVLGPAIPNSYAQIDAPAAMMVDGNILCVLGVSTGYGTTSWFYEYNYLTNAFTQVPDPNDTANLSDNVAPYVTSMLDLPDGSVLYQGSNLYDYSPSGAPLAEGQPVIQSISQNSDGSYLLTGTGLTGISQGAKYGDDKQMNTNYPIVRLTSTTTGYVYYARTYNWSTTNIMTGSAPLTTDFTLPASLPAGTYNLVVVANGNASTPVSLTTGSINAPSTPANVAATAGNATVTVTWSASSGATSYNVYRSTTSGGEGSNPIAAGITATTYTDTAVTNGATYYYTVAAANLAGTSAQSTQVSATPTTGTSCYTAWSSTAVYVAGNQASYNGENYQANYWNQNSNPSTNNGGPGSGQPWTAVGTCGVSNTCSADAPAPTGLAASTTSTTSTELSWTADTAPPNCTISGYTIYAGGTAVATNVTGTAYTVTGLNPGTTYSFTVAAVDAFGSSLQSSALSVTTFAAQCTTLPATPSGLTVTSLTSSTATVTWNAVAAPPNCTLTNYFESDGGFAEGSNPAITSFTFSGLAPSTTYTLSVWSADVAGQSSTPATVTITTPASGGGNCANIPAWSGNEVYFAAGTLVSFNGNEYKCLQSHTSQPTWDPADVAALWQLIGPC